MAKRTMAASLIALLVGVSPGHAEEADPPERRLRFPDVSIGVLSTRPASLGGLGYDPDRFRTAQTWEELGPAAGDVVIPAGHYVRLRLDRDAADCLWAEQLPPDGLDVVDAWEAPMDNAAFARLARLTGLRGLSVYGVNLTTAIADDLARLAALVDLTLADAGINDTTMAVLAALPRLESLQVSGCPITDAGFATLAESPTLVAVYAGQTAITDAGVASLCRSGQLRSLNVYAYDPEFVAEGDSNPRITDAAIDALVGCDRLASLDLTGAALTDAGLARLCEAAPPLRRLVIDNTRVTTAGLVALGQLATLESLRAYGVPIDDAAAEALASCQRLARILGDVEVSSIGAKRLASLPRLEQLNLDGKAVDNDCVEALAGTRELKVLSIQHTRITDAGFARLAGHPTLEQVQLTGGAITTRCVDTLATMLRLKQVGLMDIDARVDGEPAWAGLGGVTRLTDELWLSACPPLAPKDYATLARFEQLEELRLAPFRISRPATDADVAQLARMKSLRHLELTDTVASDDALVGLGALPRLDRLDIGGLFTDDGLRRFVVASPATRLAIASPELTDAAIEELRQTDRFASLRRRQFRLGGSRVSRGDALGDDGFWRRGTLEERSDLNALEGKPAPPIAAAEWLGDGTAVSLEELRGRVVLVDFWGTWCGPCLADLPRVRQLHDTYAERGLVVVGVHSTSRSDDAAEFVAANALPWPIAIDDAKQSAEAYAVPGYPANYLIDRAGVLRMAEVWIGEREAAIQALLDEPAP